MNNTIQYKGARFYKCALQVNPSSYAAYRGEASEDEATYNQRILEQCQENKIKVVGLADHGSVESSQGLRAFLEENEIVVFPGFEIASSEKIHMVCLYPEDTQHSILNQYLGQLMGGNISQLADQPTHASSLSCEEIARKLLDQQKGFWFAAHITGRNGLLRLSKDGNNYTHLWKNHELVIAAQIPGSIDDLNQDFKKYHKILENRNPDYKRIKPIAIINAKDVSKPEDLAIRSSSCLVKMTQPTFEALKKAFHDPESRIRLNHDLPEKPYSFIRSIAWEGAGFFEARTLAFSKNLNAVIGGRGTGKSTLIESIRFALDLPSKGGERQLEALRRQNLGSAKVLLEVISKSHHGNRYTISRRYGERPEVINEQGEPSHLTPADLLPSIELLGQNEILEIEKDEDAKLELIHYFLPDRKKFNATMDLVRKKLAENRAEIVKQREEIDSLESAVSQEQKYKEQLENFQKLGIANKLSNVQFLEKEKWIKDQVNTQFQSFEEWLENYKDAFDVSFLQAENDAALPNTDSIEKIAKIMEAFKQKIDALVEQEKEHLKAARADYQIELKNWQSNSAKITDELNQAIAQLPEQSGRSGKEIGREFQGIATQLTAVSRQREALDRQKKIVKELEKERSRYLEEYRDTAFKRYTAMSQSIEKLNKSLRGKVKISIVRIQNRKSLEKFLSELDGIGSAKVQWIKYPETIDLVEWAQWIAEKKEQSFINEYEQYDLTKGTVEKMLGMSLDRQLQLQEIELKDVVKIELNTAHSGSTEHYVDLQHLSTGQKCTAILNLLLLGRDEPLIIDQPEDNLDNAFIAEHIVSDIRQSKTKRQFLFATHNANIPIFGDAELIAVLNSEKDKGSIAYQGSIDQSDIQQQSAEILEGGKAAFKARQDKYGF